MEAQAEALGTHAPELVLEVIKVALHAEDYAASGCVIGRATPYASFFHGTREIPLPSEELCENHFQRRAATLPLQFVDLDHGRWSETR